MPEDSLVELPLRTRGVLVATNILFLPGLFSGVADTFGHHCFPGGSLYNS